MTFQTLCLKNVLSSVMHYFYMKAKAFLAFFFLCQCTNSVLCTTLKLKQINALLHHRNRSSPSSSLLFLKQCNWPWQRHYLRRPMQATRTRLFSLLIKFISKVYVFAYNSKMSQFTTNVNFFFFSFQVTSFIDKMKRNKSKKTLLKKLLLSVLTQYLKKKKSASVFKQVKEKLRT